MVPGQKPLADLSGSMTFKTTYYDPTKIPPPDSLVINMTMLDEIGFKEIVLNKSC